MVFYSLYSCVVDVAVVMVCYVTKPFFTSSLCFFFDDVVVFVSTFFLW